MGWTTDFRRGERPEVGERAPPKLLKELCGERVNPSMLRGERGGERAPRLLRGEAAALPWGDL